MTAREADPPQYYTNKYNKFQVQFTKIDFFLKYVIANNRTYLNNLKKNNKETI